MTRTVVRLVRLLRIIASFSLGPLVALLVHRLIRIVQDPAADGALREPLALLGAALVLIVGSVIALIAPVVVWRGSPESRRRVPWDVVAIGFNALVIAAYIGWITVFA